MARLLASSLFLLDSILAVCHESVRSALRGIDPTRKRATPREDAGLPEGIIRVGRNSEMFVLTLKPRRAARVRCLSGLLWITVDHSPIDRIVSPGEAFVLQPGCVALVTGLPDGEGIVVEAGLIDAESGR